MNREHSIHQKDFLKAYDELSDALFRHSFFRVSNKEVALDMVQDAFMKTWNHIVGGKIIENYKAFLYHVMNNLIIDYYRKSKSSSLDVLLDDGFDPGDTTVNIEQSAEVSLLIRSLHKLETSSSPCDCTELLQNSKKLYNHERPRTPHCRYRTESRHDFCRKSSDALGTTFSHGEK